MVTFWPLFLEIQKSDNLLKETLSAIFYKRYAVLHVFGYSTEQVSATKCGCTFISKYGCTFISKCGCTFISKYGCTFISKATQLSSHGCKAAWHVRK